MSPNETPTVRPPRSGKGLPPRNTNPRITQVVREEVRNIHKDPRRDD